MEQNEQIWKRFTKKEKDRFINQVCKGWRWKQYAKLFSHYFDDWQEMREFGRWVKANVINKKAEPKIQVEEVVQPKEEELPTDPTVEEGLLHSRSYWYDESRDVYVVHLPLKKRPFALSGSFWRSMKEAYSNWGDSPSTVNEIARRFSLPRNTVTALLRTMGVTHDSSPWSDEFIRKADEDELVTDLVRRKEERVIVRAQKIEWGRVKRDADKYRQYKLFARSISEHFAGLNKKDYAVSRMSLCAPERPFSVIISPTDFHWGKYAPAYTGDPYDRNIAKKRLFQTTKDVLSRVSMRGRPEEIILALGGDGLHIDNMQKTTTRGTPQDCDSSPMEMVTSYVEMCREYIDYVRQFANVKVYVVNGNHDYYSSIFLREALYGWYHVVSGVEVVRVLGDRQTFLYGKSLITFVHGDDGKVKDYPAIIASESAELWGKSKWRFIFTGHLHTERELPVFSDVTVYRMPSLAGTDAWHHRKGYKSRKALIAYIVDKEKGVVAPEISPV